MNRLDPYLPRHRRRWSLTDTLQLALVLVSAALVIVIIGIVL